MDKILWGLLFISIPVASFTDDEVICSGGDEFIPHENCSLFYQCSNGEPILQYCPTGYYFNPNLDICDFPQNVPECAGGTRPPPGPTTSTPNATTSFPTITTEIPTSTTTTEQPTTTDIPTTSPSPIPERQCGQIINETAGHISYKLNTTYDDNERCVWTISVPGASKYRFIVQQSEVERVYDGILVTGIRRNGDFVGFDSTQLKETQTVYEVNGNTAIVIFYSYSSARGKGFLLSFSTEVDLKPMYSENHIFDTRNTSEIVNYVRDGYENNELTTFVHIGNPYDEIIKGRFFGYFGSLCLTDYILVRKFKLITPDWVEDTRLCSHHNGTYVEHDDATLYVFKSDDIIIHDGFSFEFTSQPKRAIN